MLGLSILPRESDILNNWKIFLVTNFDWQFFGLKKIHLAKQQHLVSWGTGLLSKGQCHAMCVHGHERACPFPQKRMWFWYFSNRWQSLSKQNFDQEQNKKKHKQVYSTFIHNWGWITWFALRVLLFRRINTNCSVSPIKEVWKISTGNLISTATESENIFWILFRSEIAQNKTGIFVAPSIPS